MQPDDRDDGTDDALALAHRLFAMAARGEEGLLPYLDAGVPVDLRDEQGDSLLMLAAANGHGPLVRSLLARGADPGLANDRGQVPLASAVFSGFEHVARALLESGADPWAGRPPAVEVARRFARPAMLALFERVDRPV